jgi:hypothetical protein
MLRPRKPTSTSRKRRGESGQSLVELAFAIPLVLLVIVALVDFGLALNTWIDTTQMATEGARLASVNGPKGCQVIADKIKSDAFGELDNGKVANGTVAISFPSGASIGKPVQVLVTATFNYVPGGLIPSSPLNIKAQATMRLEQAFSSATGCTSPPS